MYAYSIISYEFSKSSTTFYLIFLHISNNFRNTVVKFRSLPLRMLQVVSLCSGYSLSYVWISLLELCLYLFTKKLAARKIMENKKNHGNRHIHYFFKSHHLSFFNFHSTTTRCVSARTLCSSSQAARWCSCYNLYSK